MSLDTLSRKNTPPSSGRESSGPRRKRSLAWLLPVGLLLGFLVILALLFGDRLVPALPVETVSVVTIRATIPSAEDRENESSVTDPQTVGKGALLFQASGWIEPDPYITYVPTLTNGVVDEVRVLEGQTVRKGELLATLIDEDAQLDLREAERKYVSLEKKIAAHCTGFEIIEAETVAARKTIEALEAQLSEARDTLSRLTQLSEGAVSRQQIVQARLAVERQAAMRAEAQAALPQLEARKTQLSSEKESMLASLDELEAARDRAQLALDRTRITSPMDGVVLHLHAAPGKKRMINVESEKSAVIVELYDPNSLQARIDVALNEAAALFVGQPVELISDLLPNTTFSGRVTRITGQADLQRNTLQVKVAIEDPDERLRPEMLVRAKFFESGDGAGPSQASADAAGRYQLYLPEEALVGEDAVWVVSPEKTARKRQVELGQDRKDGHRLILDGLRSGEPVILPPHDQLEEGMRISPNPSSNS